MQSDSRFQDVLLACKRYVHVHFPCEGRSVLTSSRSLAPHLSLTSSSDPTSHTFELLSHDNRAPHFTRGSHIIVPSPSVIRDYSAQQSRTTMAIHPDYLGLKAEVVVDGQALKEYDDDGVPQSKTLTKYVEVCSDAHFGVRYTIPQGLTGTCGVQSALLIDGKCVVSWNHPQQKLERYGTTRCLQDTYSEVDGSEYTQKFRFSQLNIGTLGPELTFEAYLTTYR